MFAESRQHPDRPYTRNHGILDNTERGPRSHELSIFARQLHDRGYNTGFIGKWRMGNDPTPRPGFDSWVAMKGQGEAIDPELYENGGPRARDRLCD